MVGRVVQEACNREMLRKRRSLAFNPDIFKTQEMRKKAVEKDSSVLIFAPFHFWTNDMSNRAIENYIYPTILTSASLCKKVVENYRYTLKFVPDHFKTQEICDKTVENDPFSLQYVPDSLLTRKQIQMWYDDYYDDDGDHCEEDDNKDTFFEWYESYKKRKAQEATIKEEL